MKSADATLFLKLFLPIIQGKKLKYLIPAGSYRRGKKIIGDLDIVSFRPMSSIMEKIVKKSDELEKVGIIFLKVKVAGELHISFKVKFNIKNDNKMINFQLDLFYAPPGECVTSMLHWTGSKNFNIRMRAQAKRLGFKLSQHGLFDIKSGKKISGIKSEKDVFKILKMSYKTPAEREE